MFNKIINIFLSILVFIYIIFEELIWEKTAKPIINQILKFEILKNLEQKILEINHYILLIIFLSFFVIVELIGIYAAILFATGKIITSIIVYSSKIPVAVFTFWFFKITKEKLFEFVWFKYLYNLLMNIIDKLKESAIYVNVKNKIHEFKKLIKSNFSKTKGEITQRIYDIYENLKNKFK